MLKGMGRRVWSMKPNDDDEKDSNDKAFDDEG